MSSEALNQRFLYIPKKALVASLILHGLFTLSFVSWKILESMGIHLFSKPPSSRTLYQEYIQVDVVALPDIPLKNQIEADTRLPIVATPKVEVAPEPVEEARPDTMKLVEERIHAQKMEKEAKDRTKKEEAQKVARRRIEEEQALKKLAQEAKKEAALKSLTQARNAKIGRAKMAGNVLSTGTGATGAVGTAKDRYLAMVYQKIKSNFNVFSSQKLKAGLVTQVHIEIYPNGRVREKTVIQASKDPLFDESVLRAIQASEPLPLPEEESLLSEGITFTFNP